MSDDNTQQSTSSSSPQPVPPPSHPQLDQSSWLPPHQEVVQLQTRAQYFSQVSPAQPAGVQPHGHVLSSTQTSTLQYGAIDIAESAVHTYLLPPVPAPLTAPISPEHLPSTRHAGPPDIPIPGVQATAGEYQRPSQALTGNISHTLPAPSLQSEYSPLTQLGFPFPQTPPEPYGVRGYPAADNFPPQVGHDWMSYEHQLPSGHPQVPSTPGYGAQSVPPAHLAKQPDPQYMVQQPYHIQQEQEQSVAQKEHAIVQTRQEIARLEQQLHVQEEDLQRQKVEQQLKRQQPQPYFVQQQPNIQQPRDVPPLFASQLQQPVPHCSPYVQYDFGPTSPLYLVNPNIHTPFMSPPMASVQPSSVHFGPPTSPTGDRSQHAFNLFPPARPLPPKVTRSRHTFGLRPKSSIQQHGLGHRHRAGTATTAQAIPQRSLHSDSLSLHMKAAAHEKAETAIPQVSVGSPSELRPDVEEFVPTEMKEQQPKPYHQTHRFEQHTQRHRSRQERQSTTKDEETPLQSITKKLDSYAEQNMTNRFDLLDSEEQIKRNTIRIPAACFNEQKLMDRVGYQVLNQPQSPAIRGQEALSRVCFALEQTCQHMGRGAVIISDYKYRENYLKHAPADVLEALVRPEVEGSHDILMFGPSIGIMCIQVTCVEASTNSGTVKKQVRETLKQLQKDVKVVTHVLRDLGLDDSCVHMVMALPNITMQQLTQKLEPKSVLQRLQDDLKDLLTLDKLPCVGHRFWASQRSRDDFRNWLDTLSRRPGAVLSVSAYKQIFSRYTCGWSVCEVWTATKPRVQIRNRAQTVAETYHRYNRPVLTPLQEDLLQSRQSHVIIEGPAGSAATCLLKVKVMMELERGCDVLIFVPRELTKLRDEYEGLARSLSEQHSGTIYFWSGVSGDTDISQGHCDTVDGSSKKMNHLTGAGQETLAVFDHINHDKSLEETLPEVTSRFTSVWVVKHSPVVLGKLLQAELADKFYSVRFSTLTRLPTAIQALISHASLADSGRHAASAAEYLSISSGAASSSSGPVSSYMGLPTDGPLPLFIWHEHTKKSLVPGIFECHRCMSKLRAVLGDLVPGLATESVAGEENQYEDRGASGSDSTHPADVEIDREPEEKPPHEGSIDLNSGTVPQPLDVSDVVIFVDSAADVEALVKSCSLVNMKRVVLPLSDLPHLIGTEKAVVGFVGRLDVAETESVLHALVSKLRDVMTLCQGQLVLVMELVFAGEKRLPHHSRLEQIEPYQLDMDAMLEQARSDHGYD